MKKIFTVTVLSSILFSPIVSAGGYMSADEVKALVTGKTTIGHHAFKDSDGAGYFDASGKTYGKNRGLGTWRVKSDGAHCIKNDGSKKERCRYIKKDGDVYKRYVVKGDVMKSHKHVWTWTKIEDGNTQNFPLEN